MTKKIHILVVDDEPVIGESIVALLEAPHRKIVVAKDGVAALTLAEEEEIDLVITDHRMPRAGGMELVRKLRQRDFAGRIIVLSGYLSEEHIGIYEDLEVDEIAAKPFDSAGLQELVAKVEADYRRS